MNKKSFRVATFCNFGKPNRKTEIGRHWNWDTARRQFKKLSSIYSGFHGWKCWQEEINIKESEDLA